MNHKFSLAFLLLLHSCTPTTRENKVEASQNQVSGAAETQEIMGPPAPPELVPDTDLVTADSTVSIGGEIYQLSVVAAQESGYYGNNALFTIKTMDDNALIFSDSLAAGFPDFTLMDYDGDRVPDIVVYCCTGARGANELSHLYIADWKSRQFFPVEGFEEHPNMEVDSNQIIWSAAYTGGIHYSFYKINSKHQLVQLGKTIFDDRSSDEEMNRAWEKVEREYQRILKKQK